MPWVVGVDEAGYGPNLGPLVQAAVGLWLPGEDPAGWATVAAHVRKAGGKDDGRLVIDDSKKVYTRGGLAALERGVHAALGTPGVSHSIESFLRPILCPDSWADLLEECWFRPAEPLPVAFQEDVAGTAASRWKQAYGSHAHAVAASVVPAPRFNRIVDESDSKATVLANGLVALLAGMRTLGSSGPAEFANAPLLCLCDKQGGRAFYTSLVQAAFPDGWVLADEESPGESRYRVMGLSRDVTVIFRPRADAGSVSVALASMLCKYIREVCMAQFNRFWAGYVPGILPTAGYPLDAKRFYEAIREARLKLGLTDHQVWRKR